MSLKPRHFLKTWVFLDALRTVSRNEIKTSPVLFFFLPCALHLHIKSAVMWLWSALFNVSDFLLLSLCLAWLTVITLLIKLQTKAAFKLGLLRFVFNEEIIPLTTQARFSWDMITQSCHLTERKGKADFCLCLKWFQPASKNLMPL